ncbi:MAG: alpha/beta fold hydrolase [Nocardioidaceae bacterium]
MSDLAVHRVRLATGITVPYTVRGAPDGTPVVLVHAWGEARGCFDTLVPHLPPDLRVVTWDLRGHGEADKPTEGYLLAQVADDVVALLDALAMERVVLVGSSSGGYVAQQVAVTRPRRVLGLVLVGSPLSLEGEPSFMAEIEALRDPLAPEWIRDFNVSLSVPGRVPDWYLEERVREGLAMSADLWRTTLRGLVGSPAPTRLGVITCPTLVLWGGDDQLLGEAQLTGLHQSFPQATVISYADTGHTVLWERPELVATDLVAFVRRLRGTSASR